MKKQPSLDLASLLRMMRNPTPKLMVELPERIEFLHGKTTSGDLKLDKLNSRVVELETTSGDIQITQMVAEESVIKASSGDIQLEQVNVSEMVLQNSSGDISWQDGQVQPGTAAYRQRRYRIDTSQWTEGRAYKRQRGHRAGRRAGRKMEGRNLQR